MIPLKNTCLYHVIVHSYSKWFYHSFLPLAGFLLAMLFVRFPSITLKYFFFEFSIFSLILIMYEFIFILLARRASFMEDYLIYWVKGESFKWFSSLTKIAKRWEVFFPAFSLFYFSHTFNEIYSENLPMEK